MRKVKFVSLSMLLLITATGFWGTLSGCGDGDNTQVTATPEAKKADESIRNGMKEFMQTKGKGKAPAKK